MIIAPHRTDNSAQFVSNPLVGKTYYNDPKKIFTTSSTPSSALFTDKYYHHDPTEIFNVKDWKSENGLDPDKPLPAVPEVLSNLGVSNGASGSSNYSSVTPADHSGKQIDYLYADLAKHYGMNTKAAYSEALQNTAYSRAVADLKRAGLNPVLAAGNFGAAGSYAAGDTLSGGSGSGSSGSRSSGMSGKYAMSESEYNLVGVAGSMIGAVAGFALGKGPYKVLTASTLSMLGKQLAQGLVQGSSSIRELSKK